MDILWGYDLNSTQWSLFPDYPHIGISRDIGEFSGSSLATESLDMFTTMNTDIVMNESASALTLDNVAGLNVNLGEGADAMSLDYIAGVDISLGADADEMSLDHVAGVDTNLETGADEMSLGYLAGANINLSEGHAISFPHVAGAETTPHLGIQMNHLEMDLKVEQNEEEEGMDYNNISIYSCEVGTQQPENKTISQDPFKMEADTPILCAPPPPPYYLVADQIRTNKATKSTTSRAPRKQKLVTREEKVCAMPKLKVAPKFRRSEKKVKATKKPLYLKSLDECKSAEEWQQAKRAKNTKRYHDRNKRYRLFCEKAFERLLTYSFFQKVVQKDHIFRELLHVIYTC